MCRKRGSYLDSRASKSRFAVCLFSCSEILGMERELFVWGVHPLDDLEIGPCQPGIVGLNELQESGRRANIGCESGSFVVVVADYDRHSCYSPLFKHSIEIIGRECPINNWQEVPQWYFSCSGKARKLVCSLKRRGVLGSKAGESVCILTALGVLDEAGILRLGLGGRSMSGEKW